MINIPNRIADKNKKNPIDKIVRGGNIFVGGLMQKINKNQIDKIRKVYEQMRIKPIDYPTYVDPYSFSTQFKKISLYKSDHLIFSSSSSSSSTQKKN